MKDPYTYEDGVLVNKLEIHDKDRLKQAEADICLPKIITAGKFNSNSFDTEFIKKLHKHIFEDIYPWAGEFRTVPIYKQERVLPGLSLEYSKPKDIQRDLDNLLEIMNNANWKSMSLDDKSMKFTRLLARLWRVHPFRDGNTRTMMTFAYLFSRSKEFPLDLSYIVPHLTRQYDENGKVTRYSIRDKLVLAALDDSDTPEPQYLNTILKVAIQAGSKKKEESDYER